MSTTEPLLVVENLTTVFDTPRGQVHAVDGVSFALHQGETLGLVGESGSGKSILGRTVMGLVSNGVNTHVTGHVRYAGQDIHALPAAQRRKLWGPEMAMVFQDPMSSLNPVKKIGTHLTETLRLHLDCSRKEAQERSGELLRQVGIAEPTRRLRQYPHELSGGMRQRVMIAIGLACSPRLLIADEPTTALDVTVQKQILDLLASLTDELNMAMILVSHDLGAVAGRTDRVQVMYAGRTVESGPTQPIFEGPHHPYADALIASIPRIENTPHTHMVSIEGNPPDMTAPPAGCRFAPRCRYAQARCREVSPDLVSLSDPQRLVACHYPLVPETSGATRTKEPTDGR